MDLYGLTPFQKPSEFERVVQALVFTLIIQMPATAAGGVLLWLGKWIALGKWTKKSELSTATIVAVVLGLLFSYLANCDRCHKLARRLGITRETSYPSEWFGVLTKNVTYVVLHLKDERRVYGWPLEWPSSPQAGHFQLQEVSWLNGEVEIPLESVDSILINVKDVKWIEFLKKTWEVQNVEEGIQSAAAIIPLRRSGA
jgi:hypothetical protein